MSIVNDHIVLRICRYDGNQQPSGRADGMFIRNDGGLTEAKISAKVFNDAIEAAHYFKTQCINQPWVLNTPNVQVFAVPAVTKTVVKNVIPGRAVQIA